MRICDFFWGGGGGIHIFLKILTKSKGNFLIIEKFGDIIQFLIYIFVRVCVIFTNAKDY